MAEIIRSWKLERHREIKRLKDELKKNPESPDIHFELGRSLLRMLSLESEKEGIKHLEKAIKLKPDFAEAMELLSTMIMDENPAKGTKLAQKAAAIYKASGNTEKVHKILNKAAMHYVYAGWEFLDADDRITAKKNAKKALDIYPQCVDAKNILASIHMENFEFTEAERIYREALADAISQQGGMIKVEGRIYWGELETRPYMRSRHGLGLCYMHLGRFKEALAEFKTMLNLNPNDNQGVRFPIANLYHYLGNRKNAERYYKEYGEHEGSYNYALLLYSKGEMAGAVKMLKESIKIAPFIATMLRAYLKMFIFWREKGLLGLRETPSLFMHRNAVINVWNENVKLAKDYITSLKLESAYDFCNLHGPLWLKQRGSYMFLLEAMDATS